MRADGSQVDELVRKLKDAKMDTTGSDEDAKKAVAGFSTGTRVAVAAVTDASGTQQIEVRKDKDKNYYAKSTVVEGIYKVTATSAMGSIKGWTTSAIRSYSISAGTIPTSWRSQRNGRKPPIRKAAKSGCPAGNKWTRPSIQAVVDKLRDLTSTKFLDSGNGPVIFEVTVTSNDGKRVEKVSIWKQGASYYAQREGEPASTN